MRRPKTVSIPAPEKPEGLKFDDNKVSYHLIPVDALDEVSRVLTFGARKYGERNWEKGIRYARLYRALLHHVWAWWCGETHDPESGLHPLAHAVCCALFLLSFERRGVAASGIDDRPRNTSPLRDKYDATA